MNSIREVNLNILKNKNAINFIRFIVIIILVLLLVLSSSSFAKEKATFAKENHSRASMDIDGNFYMRENLFNRIYPASMTKTAICIAAIEKANLKDAVVIREPVFQLPYDYVLTPLYTGETLTVEDLLYANMLKSGNDASIQLAIHIFGSEENFAKEINPYLKDLGLLDTNFTNSFGFHEDDHYTTPHDMLVLARHAMKNKTFKKIVSSSTYTIPANEFSGPRRIYSTSLFADDDSSLFNENFTGIKTGFTEEAGDCFVTSAVISNKEFYFIYSGADSRIAKFIKINDMYNETKELFKKQDFITEYNKEKNKEKNILLNTSHLNTSLFFSNFDKTIIILFGISLSYILINLLRSKKKNKKRRRSKR